MSVVLTCQHVKKFANEDTMKNIKNPAMLCVWFASKSSNHRLYVTMRELVDISSSQCMLTLTMKSSITITPTAK